MSHIVHSTECVSSNGKHTFTDQEKTYQIQTRSFEAELGFSTDEVVGTVVKGADTWNEQARSGYFTFAGHTDRPGLPEWEEDCINDGIEHSLVIFRDEAGPKASVIPRCKNSDSEGTQFQITVRHTDDNFGWGIGNIDDEWDLVHNFIHEFGHTLSIGHPETAYAAMRPTTRGETRARDLYRWDLRCSSSLGGARELSGRYRTHTNSNFSAENTFLSELSAISYGSSFHTGQWVHSATFDDDQMGNCLDWAHDLNSPTIECVDPAYSILKTIGLAEGAWQEYDWWDFILYAANHGSGSEIYGEDAKFRGQLAYSGNGYATDSGSEDTKLSYCVPTSSGSCNGSGIEEVYTGKKMGTAWDPFSGHTVVAWANQNRQNNSLSRQLNFSIGYVHLGSVTSILPVPYTLDIRSDIGPAVTCSDQEMLGGYDCMVAFTDESDPTNRLLVRRFFVYAGSTRYLPKFDDETYAVGVHTGTNVAAWYDEEHFWLAVRPTTPHQHLKIYRSPDAVNWTEDTTNIGYSAVAPTALSFFAEPGNLLGYAR